ncbi:glyoxal reductase [Chytriomyces sp. MP71]|nr:glyoxal reductase [Chytriomyces sp. MP71]
MEVPPVGFGTYRIQSHPDAVALVALALRAGYRLVDTAQVYANEAAVGEAVRASGIPRAQLFVSTKVSPKIMTSEDAVYTGALASLHKLGLDYVDLFLIHWPGTSKRNVTQPNTENRLAAWRALERVQKEGRARFIGVSNYTPSHLLELLNNPCITTRPYLNQIEFHPLHIPYDTLEVCRNHGIRIQAYSSLGEGALVQPDGDSRLKVLDEIAARCGCTRAQLLLKWAIKQNVSVIPKSSSFERMKENFHLDHFNVGDEDMLVLSNLTVTGGLEPKKFCWDPRLVA